MLARETVGGPLLSRFGLNKNWFSPQSPISFCFGSPLLGPEWCPSAGGGRQLWNWLRKSVGTTLQIFFVPISKESPPPTPSSPHFPTIDCCSNRPGVFSRVKCFVTWIRAVQQRTVSCPISMKCWSLSKVVGCWFWQIGAFQVFFKCLNVVSSFCCYCYGLKSFFVASRKES